MSEAALFERLGRVLQRELVFDDAVVPDDRLLEDVGVSLLDVPELVLELEDEFDVELWEEDLDRLLESDGTVEDLVQLLQENGASA